ncbi:MAG: DNA polymerase III subunit alpha, partial [Caulobacterales bacterium]|nr:DNA polymerase III subunit alpha [Caulobacterales bacterium]
MVETAARLGLHAIAACDRNSLAGVVRAHAAAKEAGVKLLVGARLATEDGFETVCLPTDRPAYARLTRLLTLGKRRAEKGECRLARADIAAFAEGQILILLPSPAAPPDWEARARLLVEAAPGAVYLALARRFDGRDGARLAAHAALAARLGVATVATSDALMHAPERRRLADVITCIREKTTIDEAGFRLARNAEAHLKAPAEQARLFAGYEDAVARTVEIAERVSFTLDEIAYQYPGEVIAPGETALETLSRFAWEGARSRYPGGVPDTVAAALAHELALVERLDYAPYFLTVHDLVRFARSRGILCQGRGSAANSSICFCLGVTAVDPSKVDLLFERFISAERGEPPDIDVDFEHERREEVIQYVYEKYGRHRAGLAATVITYRARSAVREVGKVLGLSADTLDALAGTVWGWSEAGVQDQHVRDELGLDPGAPRLRDTLELARALIGFPRHLSQHVGGFVITRDRLDEIAPVENARMEARTLVEWDKDDLETLGILKVDVLGLGMLTLLAKGFDLLAEHYGVSHQAPPRARRRDGGEEGDGRSHGPTPLRPLSAGERGNRSSSASPARRVTSLPSKARMSVPSAHRLDLADIPDEDPAVYDMICSADTIGVFQIESRAQMSMLPRLKPRAFYDLVIEVAIVRPGPIQGDMVHPYLRRREGLEAVSFPSAELEDVLGKTLGVPLFQEQAMKIAIVAAGFTPGEADQLRRAMATFKRSGLIHRFGERLVEGMVANGYERDFAERCFKQIEGFGEYGFPESHAASFALLVYVSAWLKHHYPDVFLAAILNAQPMGFYAPAQLVRDARAHGVEVRAPDINLSDWDALLEDKDNGSPAASSQNAFAVRLGLRQVKGLNEAEAAKIVAARAAGGPFADLDDLQRRARVRRATVERLAEADAFRSLGRDRRRALWEAKAAPGPPLPLFA